MIELTGPLQQAVDSGREYEAAALLKPDEAVAPDRIVGGEIRARYGNQASARAQTSECLIKGLREMVLCRQVFKKIAGEDQIETFRLDGPAD